MGKAVFGAVVGEEMRELDAPKDTQIGGSHYKDMAIQPIEYILGNELGYVEGAVIKYVSRWKTKSGIEDLRKARHFLDLLIAHLEAVNE